ncbi:hypothetical protein DPV79_19145 [Burkholderia reimsis]|uniref:TIR domain-containing protein n=1 Tax=Burkholderia reimsis TaxID=2234132 RepID=A0A365QTK5_9BURK|nr:toll/interleukin-1 receptor domain-containing protein [Burkholderia reimsis]RBB38193.1 hypothetical protein DPV79_19145 [Burkholderia reimsis]
MFRAFNLEGADDTLFAPWKASGEAHFAGQRQAVRRAITSYVRNDVINGLKVKADWFGQVKANVFISHAHRDEAIAVGLAGWLREEFGLDAFIDSCVWGHASELLRSIDDEYCKLNGTTYNYRLRNRSTSHVHMMLSTALTQMIDSCECVIFLNTPAAMTTDGLLDKDSDGQTSSPWIYAELVTMQVIRRREPVRSAGRWMAKASMERLNEGAMDSLEVQYPLYLNDLTPLAAEDLVAWMETETMGEDALDALYELNPEPTLLREDFTEPAQ